MTNDDLPHAIKTTSKLQEGEHDHDHGNPFLIPFLLILVFAIIEFFGGIWTQSLALLGDAWHMFSDVLALGLAMYATYHVSKARRQAKQSRAEIIVSAINAVLMLAVVIWIVFEALERLQHPQAVAGGYVMLIAFFGLVVNLVVAQRLHHQAHHHGGSENLNHRAALLHVMGDVLGSVAALVAGVVIYFTGWLAIDPLLSIVISLLLLLVTASLIKDIWRSLKGLHIHAGHDHHH
ncbi:MAG: cation transporter [Methylophilaceae bacterium 17-43-7]|jgi:cobalt-zinc-cadmium efflux system protein|nr:MAG: cation transporter [Methylophilaceae bacterium 17-43-7]